MHLLIRDTVESQYGGNKKIKHAKFFKGVERPATLLKKRLWHRCFPVNFAKFPRTLFFYRTPQVVASENSCKINQDNSLFFFSLQVVVIFCLMHFP